ncbi:hypothetical protein GGQ80_003097 [Sphingomonas jinjuensis]|uniref:Uncharacterized protein n=1 Tax=Sphingomonas jinjuensis TaxID=535907 RepID=A0A840FC07_9SPHN|nr:hypothetical protein [Sphingomonas jinjuensis]MBB4155179.1 hypothetical protein [Sphingomonas jinjuensis]
MPDGGFQAIDKVKVPFANYDIVVYFGVGIASLPFVNRYVLDGGKSKFPSLFTAFDDPIINTTISIVALIFATYILGHGIAILAGSFIEQFVFQTVGQPSRFIADVAKAHSEPGHMRRMIKQSLKKSYRNHPKFIDLARLAFHIPAIPIYLMMYWIGFYDFYESKISSYIILRVQSRLERCFDYPSQIFSDTRWFKIVEYSCANDHPVALSRMYNYLVIYGLFRSTSFLLLCCVWCEWFYFFDRGGLGFFDPRGSGYLSIRLAIVYSSYLISLIGYMKFSRRYTEEATLAFALSKVFDISGSTKAA